MQNGVSNRLKGVCGYYYITDALQDRQKTSALFLALSVNLYFLLK